MPKFRVEVRDRAMIDVIATIEVEADTPKDAVAKLEASDGSDPALELEFEVDMGLGWWDREMEPEYKVYDETGSMVHEEEY